MKIVMMGTGPFAVPLFRWLVESPHQVCLLVTRPVAGSGRRKTPANPVREFASGLQNPPPVYDPANINDPAGVARLREAAADLLMVCDYGSILSADVLATTRLGGINLHGSLLPAWRGAAPINWAIFHGATETGVSVIHMTPRLDGGPVLVRKQLAIGARETAAQLEPRMAELGVPAVEEAIQLLETWDGQAALGTRQDPGLVTQAPRLTRDQGRLDWTRSAPELQRQIRAFQPWPGSFTHWHPAAGRSLRIIVWSATVSQRRATTDPGTVEQVDEPGIVVASGQGCLVLQELQPAGKRVMSAAEFLRGRAVQPGDRLGDAD